MRVRLKGLNRVRKRLADGTFKNYWYAWKGGPALSGDPGTPEFMASYNAAVSVRRAAPEGTLLSILNKFQASADWTNLADKTRHDYKRHIKAIEAEFGDFPLAALSDRRTRGELLAWRDRIGATSRRTADYRFSVLARILVWAVDRGLVSANPCERPGRLYRANRKESVWTDADEAAFMRSAPKHLGLALALALNTGQRQGDLLQVTWAAYDGERIRFQQGKTGARIVVPVGAALKVALDEAKAAWEARNAAAKVRQHPASATILTTESGTAWAPGGDGFRSSWATACAKAGIRGLTFHDLRGTAVTRLAMAGGTEAEIASITGHSLRDVGAILDAHYLKRDPALAESAIRKLETRTKTSN